MGDHILFFYGTLMAPPILHRVIHGHSTPEPWQKALLTVKPAILHGYRRHRVRYADYPGIIPTPSSSGADDGNDTTTAGSDGEASVLGTVVWGLTDGDMYRLDRFEGSEYEKRVARVRVLENHHHDEGDNGKAGDIQEVLDAAETEGSETKEGKEVEAVTYVWTAGKERLEDAEWDFEAFKRDKMAWWVEADEKDW
ncbi:hypothetical protein CBS115989_1520 [Aspergillus niger]|uniref:Putative gamma-glutamylcyclotransferase n=1 Tax=Aspergillus niger ATCC 13496 TaxID=1353008 RepID=A0A370BN10_ASPNG|nr:disease resistance protein Aig2 [Aspergillus niger CBS 513.88]XP_025449377.1 disease resistance protein Aig2 [Aspergillus niger CBS 101883]KAI2823142.1 hypothetical protein CBS115989_1520 [Aspergillus niger]RDH15808.1 disease resistance protein Aig2 [Aspergillus niger ATCC 13496]KAI2846214.1 hypothetical protein CBS11350_3754 [Aspergillus niger]KAI2847152.1 hypothetical protein CBS11232_7186 [Aspergillus niger]KAI2880388.1 hypothetical protein CBS115988_1477 [Aspergillus niger]|eukprot:XP_001393851.2 disease resistance protein Aig2 [Aspergillus niger CBS 513.88]